MATLPMAGGVGTRGVFWQRSRRIDAKKANRAATQKPRGSNPTTQTPLRRERRPGSDAMQLVEPKK
jgi:hypothetical protein